MDPRSARWEMQPTAYRVYFWSLAAPGMKIPDGSPMYASSEFELSGARDVKEVLDWARRNADGRTYTVYAVVDTGSSGRGIIHVFGIDPTHAA